MNLFSFQPFAIRDHPKKKGKNSDIMQKGGRGLDPNHYLRTQTFQKWAF